MDVADRQRAHYALVFINWNTPQLTLAAAKSAQSVGGATHPIRIIIVDNGSEDDSLDVFARELPEAEVIARPENNGFARAVNAALKRVDEPFAFVLNSDIEFRNDALTLLADALEDDDRAALACPKLFRPDGTLQAAAVPEPRLFWELTNRSLPRRLMRVPENRTSVVPGIVGPCMAVHMERIRKVGFLDDRFFFFFEETDWCKRVNDAGMHVLYVPKAEVVHLQGESANTRPVRARIQFYASRYTYFRKHGGWTAAAVLFSGLCLRLSMSMVIQSLFVLLSLGRKKYRDKLAVYAVLWIWHVRGCRPKWGFEP